MTKAKWGEGLQTIDEKREIKRAAILRVAARAFNQGGFQQTSLAFLAKELNVTKPTLYYYAKDKDDILLGILEVATEQFRHLIQEAQTFEGSGLERLRYFYRRYGEVVTDDFGTCLVLMRINSPAAKFRVHYRMLSGEVLSAMETIIRVGIDDGSIGNCDAKYMASAMLGTMNETVYWHIFEERESPIATADSFFKTFLSGLSK